MNEWQQPPDSVMSPPVEQAAFDVGPTSKWPTAVGTVSIILGALGLLCYGCSSANTIATPFMRNMVPPEMQDSMVQGVQLWVGIVTYCLGSIMSLWLLIAGVGLVRRRSWARGHHVGWAFVKILVTVASTVVAILMMDQNLETINKGFEVQGMDFAFTKEMLMGITIAFLVWFLIYPVFLIMYMSRDRVKAEAQQWDEVASGVI